MGVWESHAPQKASKLSRPALLLADLAENGAPGHLGTAAEPPDYQSDRQAGGQRARLRSNIPLPPFGVWWRLVWETPQVLWPGQERRAIVRTTGQ